MGIALANEFDERITYIRDLRDAVHASERIHAQVYNTRTSCRAKFSRNRWQQRSEGVRGEDEREEEKEQAHAFDQHDSVREGRKEKIEAIQ